MNMMFENLDKFIAEIRKKFLLLLVDGRTIKVSELEKAVGIAF